MESHDIGLRCSLLMGASMGPVRGGLKMKRCKLVGNEKKQTDKQKERKN